MGTSQDSLPPTPLPASPGPVPHPITTTTVLNIDKAATAVSRPTHLPAPLLSAGTSPRRRTNAPRLCEATRPAPLRVGPAAHPLLQSGTQRRSSMTALRGPWRARVRHKSNQIKCILSRMGPTPRNASATIGGARRLTSPAVGDSSICTNDHRRSPGFSARPRQP